MHTELISNRYKLCMCHSLYGAEDIKLPFASIYSTRSFIHTGVSPERVSLTCGSNPFFLSFTSGEQFIEYKEYTYKSPLSLLFPFLLLCLYSWNIPSSLSSCSCCCVCQYSFSCAWKFFTWISILDFNCLLISFLQQYQALYKFG